jgi:hypothetical protein
MALKWMNDADWKKFTDCFKPDPNHKALWGPVVKSLQRNLEFIKVNGGYKPSHKQCFEMIADFKAALKELEAYKLPVLAEYINALKSAIKTGESMIKNK